MIRKRFFFVLLVATLLLASCGENHDVSPADSPVGKQGEMALPVDDAHWTYYSLEQGKIMGTSLFGDGNEDARWKQRTDWDIAVCGDLLRTNSGSSGMGEGGLQVLDRAFPSVEEAPRSGYTVDDFQ